MNDVDQTWRKLVGTAKLGAADHTSDAPFGFSTRAAARWLAGGRPPLSAWELLSVRSVGLALLVMLLSLTVSFSAVQDQFTPEAIAPTDVAALLTE